MTLFWCSNKFAQLYKLSLCNKINIQPFLVEYRNIAPLVVNIYLGLRPREIFLHWVQYLSIFHAEGWNIYNIYRYVRHTFVARSWGDVMWEELSASHF